MTRNQSIRHECLLQLYGAGLSIALSPAHIAKVCKREGDDFSKPEIHDALLFLKGQGFAEVVSDPGTGAQSFRITSAGVIHYETTNPEAGD